MAKAIQWARVHQKKWLFALCLGAALLCTGTVLYHIIFVSPTEFFYDTGDTLHWAYASYEAGSLLSSDFIYVYILPIGANLFMWPFVGLFGLSMTTQVIGMTLFVLVFMASLWFFCSGLDISTNRRLLLYSAVLALLSSSTKLREIMWEHTIFYSLGIWFALLIGGVLLRLLRRLPQKVGEILDKRRLLPWWAALAAVCFLAGMDGMMILAFSALPLAGALVMERVCDGGQKLLDRANWPVYATAGVMGSFSALGYAFVTLLIRLTGAQSSTYSENMLLYSYPQNWVGNALKIPEFWIRLMGVNPHSNESIAGLSSLGEMLHVAAALLLLAVPLVAALRYKTLRGQAIKVLLWFHLLLSALLLYIHVAGNMGVNEWRLTPMLFSGLVVTVLYLGQCLQGAALSAVAQRFCAGAAACLMLLGALNLGVIWRLPTDVSLGTNREYWALADFLQQNDLTYGYGKFEISHSVTVFTNQQVSVRHIETGDYGIRPVMYQTMPYWYDDVPGQEEYFFVGDREEILQWENSSGWGRLLPHVDRILEFDHWQVLVFKENPINIP